VDLQLTRIVFDDPRSRLAKCIFASALLLIATAPFDTQAALADRIENQVAVFSALDKVTAHISKFKIELGKTAVFGPLKITPHVCYSRPATEEPKTTTFVEIDENQLDGSTKRVFTGWMFAESPGIYGLEHPTLDVWLAECEKPLRATAEQAPQPAPGAAAAGDQPATDAPAGDAQAPPSDDPNADTPPEFRRRVRR
jgi:hypothetical protein